MLETVFYVGQGSPSDKHALESYGFVQLLHGLQQLQSFRNAECSPNGAVVSGIGSGERVLIASPNKALINVYSYGKEGVDQRMPVPEQLNCLALLSTAPANQTVPQNVPHYKVPWLLAGGSKSGKLYIWELLSGELLFTKDIHYQSITKLAFSKCGTFLVTASEDSRCLVYKTIDLVLIFRKDYDANPKPYWSITDHTLLVTDMKLSQGSITDVNLHTVSKDGTLRVYNLFSKQLLHTFVMPEPAEAVAVDPSNRNIYVGFASGKIRVVSLFKVVDMNLQRVGNFGEIVTVDGDPELKNTLTVHETAVTQLDVSLDGMCLVSGDKDGNVYACDINSKQIVKSFKNNSAITSIYVLQSPLETKTNDMVEKKNRLLPPLKRVLNDSNQMKHEISVEITATNDTSLLTAAQWIDQKAREELLFKTSSEMASFDSGSDEKVDRLSKAYSELKAKYDELLSEHKKVLGS